LAGSPFGLANHIEDPILNASMPTSFPQLTHADAEACIRLLGQEMFRPLREMAMELGLNSPFETG
jgi:hypothetical protein